MAKQRRGLANVGTSKDMANTPAELEAAILARHEAAAKEAEKAAGPTPRTKSTFDIPSDLMRELRVAVSELSPKNVPGGLSGIVARGIKHELERLRRAHNDGKPFKSDAADIRAPKGPARG